MQGAGCRLCCRRAPRDSVAPAFQPKKVFRRAGLRSFSLRDAAAGGLACGSSVGRIRDSFAGTRPSAIEPFYRATEDVSSETFFRSGWPTANISRCGGEAGSFGRRCTLCRRSEPLRVLSVAYAAACGGTGRRDFLFGAIWGRRLVPRLARSGRLRAGMTDGPVRCWRLGSDGRRPRCGGPGRSDVRSASCGHRAGDRPDSCRLALFFRSGAAVLQKVLPQICRGDGASKGTGRNGRRGSEFLERNNKKPVFYVIFAQRGFLSRTSACRGRACSGT